MGLFPHTQYTVPSDDSQGPVAFFGRGVSTGLVVDGTSGTVSGATGIVVEVVVVVVVEVVEVVEVDVVVAGSVVVGAASPPLHAATSSVTATARAHRRASGIFT